MNIVLFEDYYNSLLHPLSTFHPAFDLYAGFTKIYQKAFNLKYILKDKIDSVSFIARKNQLSYFLLKNNIDNPVYDYSEDVLFINSRLIDFLSLSSLKENCALCDENKEILAIRTNKKLLAKINPKNLYEHSLDYEILGLCNDVQKAPSIKYLFDIISNQKSYIEQDKVLFIAGRIKEFKHKGNNLFIHPKAKVHPLTSIEPLDGIIIIDKEAQINAFTEVRGSCYIGPQTIVDRGYIHDNVTIGSNCRISGEIEASIISDFSNKHHTGFLGHSYLGEWVNIGAMTTTSDLKNNYSNIKFIYRNNNIDSGQIKMGSLFGDHVKCSIGLMINCGTIIGECTILFENPKSKAVAHAMWGEEKHYDYSSLIKNIEKIMKRRNVPLTKEYIALINELYD
jgi:UDP-N-acetylglucosamine diphosphorylase/glucosamine-1-phosphate N-acetyltransferase